MMGTSFSVTEATRCTPPRKTKAEATATTAPMIQGECRRRCRRSDRWSWTEPYSR